MKKLLQLSLISILVLSACQAPIETTVDSQTFSSENGDFEYTLNWNSKQLTLSEEKYEETTENAPSFDIEGGGTISVATNLIDSPGLQMNRVVNSLYYGGEANWLDSEPKPIEAGHAYPTYYFDDTEQTECIVRYGVVKGENEAIFIRLKDCEDNDMRSGQAFEGLLSNIELSINTQ